MAWYKDIAVFLHRTPNYFAMFQSFYTYLWCFGWWLSYGFAIYAQPTADSTLAQRSTAPKIQPEFRQSNPNLSLSDFLRGARYALIEMTDKEQATIDATGSVFLKNFADYLRSIGIEKIAYTSDDKAQLLQNAASLCDIVRVTVRSGLLKGIFTAHTLSFKSCLGDQFEFASETPIYNDAFLIDKMFTLWENMYNDKKTYSVQHRLSLPSRPSPWRYDSLNRYLTHATDPIEGIYERLLMDNTQDKTRYNIPIVKNATKNGYDMLYISGLTNKEDWQMYEYMGKIYSTATQALFEVDWYRADKSLDDKVYMSADDIGVLHFSFTGTPSEVCRYFKTFPRRESPEIKPMATGTGIAISPQGYIVTNYHVVEGGSVFEVQGYQNKQLKTYNAVLLKKDIPADLAILKINSFDFDSLPSIPFTLETNLAAKGEEVFTLGFPLSGQLGTESKLTDGTISAESGYQGDPSSYQTSVAVLPGNSGGGLFDKNGNLVGFMRAKFAESENVTYAIKARNVLNLLDLPPEIIKPPRGNTLKGLPLQEQIQKIENFVFFIKVYM